MRISKKYQREYRIWKLMRARCNAPCFKQSNYQLNGLKVCEEWNSFGKFIEDMGPCPEKHSIDRVDNDLGYYPANCRWADSNTQSANRGKFNLHYTYQGETKILKDWARHFKIKYTTLYLRIKRNGLSFEDAIKSDPYQRLVNLNGEQKILKDWCKVLDLRYTTVVDRIHSGWSVEKALSTKTPRPNK